MKKRFFSLLLAFVLALSLLPKQSVFSAATSYDFMVGAVSVTSDNAADILGDGLFSFNAATNTLTVKGSKAFNVNAIVNNNPKLTIYVENDATLTSNGATTLLMDADTRITGPGKLKLAYNGSKACPIYLGSNTLRLEDADLEAQGADVGISGRNDKSCLVVRNSSLVINAANAAIRGLSELVLDGSRMVSPKNWRLYNGEILDDDDGANVAKTVRIEPIRYDLWISGTQVAEINREDVLEDGSCEYDPEVNTLYLYRDIKGTGNLIVSAIQDLTIYVSNDVLLDTSETAIAAAKDLSITGPGKLNLLAAYGIYATQDANVTLVSANVQAVGQYCICGGLSGTNALSVRNSNVQAAAFKEAISGFKGGIELYDCSLTEPADGRVGARNIENADGTVAKTVTITKKAVYDLQVGGVTVDASNADDILGNGVFSYDAEANTLTVNGDYDGGSYYVISNEIPNLTVCTARDSVLSSNGGVFFTRADASMTGPGKLTLNNKNKANCGVYVTNGATLTIRRTTVDAVGKWGITGNHTGEKLDVRNSKVHAAGSAGAVSDFQVTHLIGCEITAPEGGKISSTSGNVLNADGSLATDATISPESFDLTVAGVPVTTLNADDILGDRVFRFSPGAKTLVVSGDCSRINGILIYSRIMDLKIYAETDATLSTSDNVIVTTKSCTITGPGKLTLKSSKTSGIQVASSAEQTLILEDANLEINASYYGISSIYGKGELFILNSTVHAVGGTAAISGFNKGVYLSNCAVTAPEGGYVQDGSIVDKNGVIAAEVTITKSGLPCSGGDDCPGKVFTDMPPKGHYAHDAIDWAIVNHITSGTSKTKFSPDKGCTRGQVVTFLWRAAGEPEPTLANNPFKDVQTDAYYYKAVLWAVEKKITTGATKTTFNPDGTCTRAQIVTFLWRYEGKPEPTTTDNPFYDVKAGEYYEKAVLWASEAGVTAGTSKHYFSPDKTCTRAQVVTFLYRDIVG